MNERQPFYAAGAWRKLSQIDLQPPGACRNQGIKPLQAPATYIESSDK